MLILLALTAASIAGWWFGDQRRGLDADHRVVDVLDGDTIVVARGNQPDTIRLLGIDTPETHHPTKPVQGFGPEASAYTTRRLAGRIVRLEDDVETHDIYGRHLAYVYVDGHRFDDEPLEQGYARRLAIEPNHAHARAMLDEELDAKRHRRGLWGEC